MDRDTRQARARFNAHDLGRVWICALVALVTFAFHTAPSLAQSADEKPWEIAPYRVHVFLDVDASRKPDPDWQATLLREIVQRIDAGMRPWWNLTLEVATDPATKRFCHAPRELPWDELPAQRDKFDKLFWLGVAAMPAGDLLTCREFDVFTRRWGPLLKIESPQDAMLADACYRALAATFTPLAMIEPIEGEERVRLRMKAGALPAPPAVALLVKSGDAFLPLLRRTRRGANAGADLTSIPWTYVIVAKHDDRVWTADVDSAMRNPFASRRRGMVEQVAVGLRTPAAPARVRFFPRSNPEGALAGYEVYRVSTGGGSPALLGVTDRDGLIAVPAEGRATSTLLLRSDGQVLAKLVIAAGAVDVLQAPIADDAVRLAAQAEVQAVREELIDVVARRAIMVARVKRLLKDKDLDEARTLMSELNDLPTPAIFKSRIDQVRSRLPTSEDPRVRQTVDLLFSSTQELLARFLDARTVTSLQAEVNEASRSAAAGLAPGQ
jgi:hypothetical protein